MTSSPRSASPLVMLSMSVLMWSILLFSGLRNFLGGEASTAWVIIGVMVTSAGVCFVLLIKEAIDAVMPSGLSEAAWACRGWFRKTRGHTTRVAAADRRNTIDLQGARELRRSLGLPPRRTHCNRRRSRSWLRNLFLHAPNPKVDKRRAVGNLRMYRRTVCIG